MKKFLYSRWFFLFLAVVCALDLTTDVIEEVWGRTDLNIIAIVLDAVALALVLWIFADLQRRNPRNGSDSGRR